MTQTAIALDQCCNALLGGWADETLSARLFRNRNRSWWWAGWHRVVDGMFFWQAEHCYASWIAEVQRKHMPRSYRC